ncbi:hypothetical protein SAMN05421827_11053 [Pedobacter terrae]|uniref:DUF6265 domain-containing protein n=1 Tax=Pedobacter terrae TaxID=405671 RepID=A0A1G7WLZ8_9SPHI|nr:DUF6265 family protein [Pedobacter terrae]SDG73017.1 hypothetical protein SAMN05421827_11053 [Pedobacter terrae]
MKNNFLILAFLCFSVPAFAQLKKATVKDLAFMSGTWVQKSDWGDLEEFWSEPNGESMMSSFRCVKNGKALFYEFVVIELEEGFPVMKMRHFNRGNVAWEDKEKPLLFPLVTLKGKLAVFEMKDKSVRLSYQLIAKNKLTVVLEEKDKNGQLKKDFFSFNRKLY